MNGTVLLIILCLSGVTIAAAVILGVARAMIRAYKQRKCLWFPGQDCTGKCDHDMNGCDRLEPPAEFWERKIEDALPDDVLMPPTLFRAGKLCRYKPGECSPACKNYNDRIKTPGDCIWRGRLD